MESKADSPSVFTRIINRELPAKIFFENERIIVIESIQKKTPVHLLGITKKPFTNLEELLKSEENKDLLWELLQTLSRLAKELNIDQNGYRIVTNNGPDAGQTVFHLHIHLIGGSKLAE